MTLKQLLSIVLIISTSIVHAAADESSDVFTFYSDQLIKSAHDKRFTPHIEHHIDPNDQETLSGKTFQELFNTNACKNCVPWLLATTLVTRNGQASPLFDYVDIVELFKNQPQLYCKHLFSSSSNTLEQISSLLANSLRAHYPSQTTLVSVQLSSFIYLKTDSISSIVPNSTCITSCIKNRKTGSSDSFGEESCILAIALGNNYSHLLPIINALAVASLTKPELAKKRDFWTCTFLSLSEKKQKKLYKKYAKTYGQMQELEV